MALPVQACCWPAQLERWTLPGLQPELPGLLAWPVQAWRLALQQRVLRLA